MIDMRNPSRCRPPVSTVAKQAVAQCPVCLSEKRRPLYDVREHEYHTTTTDTFPLVACADCGAWFLDPRPAAAALDVIYPPNYYAHILETRAEGDLDKAQGGAFYQLATWLFKKRIHPIVKHLDIGPDTNWLDVGCGNGYVLAAMRDAFGLTGVGLDYDATAVGMAQKRGFEAYVSRFEDFAHPTGTTFDLIHSSHVIEHVESPYDYMRRAYDLLKPGGLNVFITPNTATWEAKRFGRHWGGLHVPRHWSMLDPTSVKVLGEKTGFEHVETCFSTNGTFWTWSFHSFLKGKVPDWLNDAVFPSDQRFVESNAWNVVRIGGFTIVDLLNVIVTGQSSNMLAIYRKPR